MTSSAPGTGRLIAAAAVIFAVAQVTACGSATRNDASSAKPPTASASSSASAATSPAANSAAAAACASSALKPSLGVAGAAAGTAYYALRLTNVSLSRCRLSGYPGVSFVGGGSPRQIGTAATRNALYPAVTVLLAPHATAHAMLGIATAANYPASSCRPATAQALRIYPPGQTAAIYIAKRFDACAARVPVLSVTTVRAGMGGNGS
jgi:Domain of unknown function (DUF4232)